jgi:hypothetical protein
VAIADIYAVSRSWERRQITKNMGLPVLWPTFQDGNTRKREDNKKINVNIIRYLEIIVS